MTSYSELERHIGKTMIRNLIPSDDPRLTQKSKKIEVFDTDLRVLLDDMWETVAHHNGLGLSAVQIGENLRVCVVRINNTRFELINPAITRLRPPYHISVEGCLSLPNVRVDVKRANTITFQGRDARGRRIGPMTVTGLVARCLQHEIDHMDGILITQRGWVYPTSENNNVA